MTKTFVAKPGDRWTREYENLLWLYRDGRNTSFRPTGMGEGADAWRSAKETDLPTPDALAQLREWGYVVTGDVAEVKPSSPTILPFGWYSQTISEANWAGPAFDPPITESRVREIVAEVLAQRSQTGHYSHAVDDARVREIVAGMLAAKAPPPPDVAEPDWKGLLRELEDSIGDVMKRGTFVPSVTLAELNIVLVRLNNARAAARKAVGK